MVNRRSQLQPVSWSLQEEEARMTTNNALRVSIPLNWLPNNDSSESALHFALTESNDDNLVFTPSWRSNHSPMKLKDFLRGQKVPLHERRSAPVILLHRGLEEISVVAVYIENSDRWVIDARFISAGNKDFREIVLRWT
jgi:hypothetical protein